MNIRVGADSYRRPSHLLHLQVGVAVLLGRRHHLESPLSLNVRLCIRAHHSLVRVVTPGHSADPLWGLLRSQQGILLAKRTII